MAWHELGWRAAWLAEVDVAASTVLAHRLGASAPVFPLEGTQKSIEKIAWGTRLTNWGDMTRLPGLIESGEAEAPDVLCGGTPCQDFSVAGLRAGLHGDRGNLTLTYVEIANAIDTKRAQNGDEPCIVFWENVPGVLSDRTNAFGCFLAGLAGEDVPLELSGKRWSDAGVVLGPQRAVAWRVLDAQYFGLAQRRKRVFVVASAREGFDPAAILFEFDCVRRDSTPSREAWEEVAGTLDARTTGGGFPGSDGACANHVVPAPGSGRPFGVAPQWWDGSPISQTLDAVLSKGQCLPEKNRFPAVLQPMPFDTTQLTSPSNYSKPRPGDPCHPLAAGAHPPAIAFAHQGGGKQTNLGFDQCSKVTQTLSANQSIAVCTIGTDLLFASDLCPTLRAGGNSTGGDRPPGTDVDTADSNIVMPNMRVRRLLPIECDRLQGFPDDWGLVPTTLVSAKGQKAARDAMIRGDRRFVEVEGEIRNTAADGPRYKQLGNSWAVNCVAWIGRRVAGHAAELESVTLDAYLVDVTWLTCP